MSSKLAGMGSKGRKAFQGIENPHNRFNNNLDRTTRKVTRSSSGMSSLVGLAGRLGIAFSASQLVGNIFKLGMGLEQTEIGFETMLGSAERAKQLIKDLNTFSKETPFSQKEILTSGRNLTAFGVAQNRILPTMKMLGNVASGLNIPFNELSEIYGKIKTQNTVFNEDLNQLAGRGIPIFDELAKVMGKSPSEIKKLSSQGQISFPIIEKAFENMSAKGGRFFDLMKKQSESTGGRWESFMDRIRLGATDLGTRALPYLNKLIDWGHGLLDILPQITVAVGIGGSVWLAYIAGVKLSAFWTKLMTVRQWALNAAMAANPVGLIIVGVLALAAAFTYAYNQLGWFRGGIDALSVLTKQFGLILTEYVINRFSEILSGLSSTAQALKYFFKGEWSKAWETGKEGMKNLTGFGADSMKVLVGRSKAAGLEATKAYMKGAEQAEKNKKQGFLTSMLAGTGLEKLINPSSPSSTTDGATGVGGGSGLGDAVTNGIDSINGGGSRQTNITVTFDKLVENFTISSQNVSQGMAQSEEELKRMLLRVLNSMNQMQTSPV